MPYFNYTRLNLYLDLLPVIGFQHFIALRKAHNKRNQIVQFLQRNFSKNFAQTPLQGFCTFSAFLEYPFRFNKFENVFADLVKSLGQGLFKNVFVAICAFFGTIFASSLDFVINTWIFTNLPFFADY